MPSESSIFQWSQTGTSVLAVMKPLAATAGKPIPGATESPQQYKPLIGVFDPNLKCSSSYK